jgi:hypothetical protein
MVTRGQAAQLKELIENRLLETSFRRANPDEGEVQYTSNVLHPLIREFCDMTFNHDGIIVRGDGAKLKSPVVSLLGSRYNPDVSIEQEKIRVWACEVKLLNEVEIAGVIAKAIGQATIYARSYLATSCVIFVRNPVKMVVPQLNVVGPNLNLLVIPTK